MHNHLNLHSFARIYSHNNGLLLVSWRGKVGARVWKNRAEPAFLRLFYVKLFMTCMWASALRGGRSVKFLRPAKRIFLKKGSLFPGFGFSERTSSVIEFMTNSPIFSMARKMGLVFLENITWPPRLLFN